MLYGEEECTQSLLDSIADGKLRFKNLFISDVHLGKKNSQAKALCRVFDHAATDNLFLLGDIVDFEPHNLNFKKWQKQFLTRVFASKARKTYTPGNHDEVFRGVLVVPEKWSDDQVKDYLISIHGQDLIEYFLPTAVKRSPTCSAPYYKDRLVGKSIFGIDVTNAAVFEHDEFGRALLAHGDAADVHLREAKKRAEKVADKGLEFSYWFDSLIIPFHDEYSTLSALLNARPDLKKDIYKKCEESTQVLTNSTHLAKALGLNFAIMGHSHLPGHSQINDMLAINLGSSTGSGVHMLAELQDGRLAILRWKKKTLQAEFINGPTLEFKWEDLGLKHFSQDPEIWEGGTEVQKAEKLIKYFKNIHFPDMLKERHRSSVELHKPKEIPERAAGLTEKWAACDAVNEGEVMPSPVVLAQAGDAAGPQHTAPWVGRL